MNDVIPGQIWADKDPREKGRNLRVDSVTADRVHCTVISAGPGSHRTGNHTSVSLKRFVTAFRLLEKRT